MATKRIQPASKKIKKAKTAANIHSQDTRLKKYKTLTKAEKSIIIQSLMSELSFPFNGEEFSRVRFLNHLKVLDQNGKKSYNVSLQKVLTKYVDSDVFFKQTLKQWRRKVKDWVQNCGKPETRGGVLVPDDKLEWFKAKLIPILHNLPKKSFNSLKEKLLPIFEEMHQKSDQSDQPFNPKTCSKHFWYDFLKKNSDINEIYKAIPNAFTSQMTTVIPVINTIKLTDIPHIISPILQDFNITSPFPNAQNQHKMNSLANEVATNSYNCDIPTTVLGFSGTNCSIQQQMGYPSSAQENEAIDFHSFNNQAFTQFQNFIHEPSSQEIFENTFSFRPSKSSRGLQNESSFFAIAPNIKSNNQENQTTYSNQNNMPNTNIESVMDSSENKERSFHKDGHSVQDMLNISDFFTTDSEVPENNGTNLFAHKLECLIEELNSLTPFNIHEINRNN